MRRRMMLNSRAGVSPVLPAAYQQVEYIGISESGPYISTNYVPVQGDEINIRCKVNGNKIGALLSAGSNDYQTIILSDKANRQLFLKMFQSGNASNIANDLTADLEIILRNPTSSVNGVNVNTPYQGALNGNETSLWLFRRRGGTTGAVGIIIYSLSITSNGIEKLNLIPCYRKSDNEIGMYDTVSETFYANADSGTFIKGADI